MQLLPGRERALLLLLGRAGNRLLSQRWAPRGATIEALRIVQLQFILMLENAMHESKHRTSVWPHWGSRSVGHFCGLFYSSPLAPTPYRHVLRGRQRRVLCVFRGSRPPKRQPLGTDRSGYRVASLGNFERDMDAPEPGRRGPRSKTGMRGVVASGRR